MNLAKHWQWHRLLGALAAIPLLTIAVSGIVLAFKAEITAALPAGIADPWPTVYQLHRSLVAGEVGKVVMSLFGVSLWSLWFSGRRIARPKGRRQRSWHQRLGRVFGLPLAVVCTLGALLNFRGPLSDWFDPIDAKRPTQVTLVTPAVLQTAQQEAAQQQVDGQPLQVRGPTAKQPFLVLFTADDTRFYADPNSGHLVKIRRPWSHWTSALHPLHTLQPLGPGGPWLSALLGLLLIFLTGQGLSRLRQKVTP